jgi:hypothetical protein
MATRKERRAQALRKHVEFCRERTRQNQAREINGLEAEERKRRVDADAAATRARAAFRVVNGGAR